MEKTIIENVAKSIMEMMQTVARLEEKLIQNEKDHREIIDKMDKLCTHVNHELDMFDDRVEALEHKDIELKSYWKVIVTIAGGTSGLLSLVILVLKYIGVIV